MSLQQRRGYHTSRFKAFRDGTGEALKPYEEIRPYITRGDNINFTAFVDAWYNTCSTQDDRNVVFSDLQIFLATAKASLVLYFLENSNSWPNMASHWNLTYTRDMFILHWGRTLRRFKDTRILESFKEATGIDISKP